jgi:hypothetical protein
MELLKRRYGDRWVPVPAFGDYSQSAQQIVEDPDGPVQVFLVMRAEDCDLSRQGADAASTRLEEQALAFHGGGEADDASIARTGALCDEALGFERVDDAGHRRWTDLLGIGETAEGDRAAEDDDREGRKPSGIEAGGRIRLAQPAQQMNGSRVKRLGGGFGIDAFSS